MNVKDRQRRSEALKRYWADEKCSGRHRFKLREIPRHGKASTPKKEIERRRKIKDSLNEYYGDEERSRAQREKTREMGRANKGVPQSEESRIKRSKTMSEKFQNEEFKQRFLRNHSSGSNHYNWKGGKSFEPYGMEFNSELRLQIRARDNFTCQSCGMSEEGSVEKQWGVLIPHHIDYDKENNAEGNLITLCRSCNCKANFNREYWQPIFEELIARKLKLVA